MSRRFHTSNPALNYARAESPVAFCFALNPRQRLVLGEARITVSFLLWGAAHRFGLLRGKYQVCVGVSHLVPRPRWALIVIQPKRIAVQFAAKPTGADENRAKAEKRPGM